jgi:hypothetical protein
MIQKLTVLNPSTSCSILKIKTFHVYSKKRSLKVFGFTKNSVKLANKKNPNIIGKKIFSFFCKQTFFSRKNDSSFFCFLSNNSVFIKKKKKIIGSFFLGFISKNCKYLKFKNKFAKNF